MRTRNRFVGLIVFAIGVASAPRSSLAAGYTLVGWNNLGMHCMDGDYGVLSLLPPFNTVDAQLVDPQGHLVNDPTALGITVTYEAVADPDGSINTTAAGKTNFWQHVQSLFGLTRPVDVGLFGAAMPGAGNVPRPMTWDSSMNWFEVAGVPITPIDDAGHENPYPLMRLVARGPQGNVLATTDVVLPVSDEMDCKSCHASGSSPVARPTAGWVNEPDSQRDMRFNILRLHDEREASNPVFQSALAAAGYDPNGLEVTVRVGGRSILCATCHTSEALPGSGQPGVPHLTQAMHGRHAAVTDPQSGLTLDAEANRAACYRCHPGSLTRCLRGAMGSAVSADGTLAMQCQSCHGTMSAVGNVARTGWLDEPSCQNCHSGTATSNAGQIRFTSVFDAPGHRRLPADDTFATNDDVPGPGLSLYRFSSGHGGLKCEACHGSTHAEFPASHRSDNIQSIDHQGHVGTLAECTTCHPTVPNTVDGGPHGMHPIGATWVDRHGDVVEQGGAGACRACHGADDRGTVLSRAQGPRTLQTEFGTKVMWRGFQVGCYMCHRGASEDEANPNRAAVVAHATASTTTGTPVAIPLTATDADGDALTLRVVTQPSHGTAGLTARTATFFPEAGFTGSDTFTVAAWDGSIDSNLATVTVHVGDGTGCTGRDLDGDGIADVCDPADGVLTLRSVTVRSNNGTTRATATGEFPAHDDTFDASTGIAITIADGGSLAVARRFEPAECPANRRGALRCRSTDRLAQATFAPKPRVPGTWKLKIRMREAGPSSSPQAPGTVTVTHGVSVDRVGHATSCKATTTSLSCR